MSLSSTTHCNQDSHFVSKSGDFTTKGVRINIVGMYFETTFPNSEGKLACMEISLTPKTKSVVEKADELLR